MCWVSYGNSQNPDARSRYTLVYNWTLNLAFSGIFVRLLELKALTEDLLPNAYDLDRLSLGGMWSLDSYQREMTSPNSDLLVLRTIPPPALPPAKLSGDSLPPIVGLACSWAILEEAHITLLLVHPDYHQQGLGQTLLYGMLDRARRRGLERATLEVKVSNQPAINLYEKFGFQQVGRRKKYYQDTGEDGLVLWRNGLHRSEFYKALADWRRQIQHRLAQANWQMQL